MRPVYQKTRNRLDGVSLHLYLKGKKGNPIKCYTGVNGYTCYSFGEITQVIITHGVDLY